MMHKVRLILVGLFSALLCSGCMGTDWRAVSSKKEIQRASPKTEDLVVRNLPVQDFPALVRFPRLRQADFSALNGKGGTNEKLEALAKINPTNLQYVILRNCPLVTDEGIKSLAKVPSLKGLGLEGTSITDESCKVMATQMHLTGVNIANCKNVTYAGLEQFSQMKWDHIMFSAENLTPEQVLQLINSYTNIDGIEIVDTQGKLDAKAVEAMSTATRPISVRAEGALQTMLKYWENKNCIGKKD